MGKTIEMIVVVETDAKGTKETVVMCDVCGIEIKDLDDAWFVYSRELQAPYRYWDVHDHCLHDWIQQHPYAAYKSGWKKIELRKYLDLVAKMNKKTG